MDTLIITAKFTSNLSKFNLSDIVLIYHDGIMYKSIVLSYFNHFPIIYDKFFDNDTYYDISITHCPFTFCSKIYFGKMKLHDELYNNNIVLIDEHFNKITQFDNKNILKSQQVYYRKLDCMVMLLRNALSLYSDFGSMSNDLTKYNTTAANIKSFFKNSVQNASNILDARKNNNIRDDTFIYGIEYLSFKTGKKKWAALIPTYASSDLDNNFNYETNGYHNYFKMQIKKFKKKSAIITPCYYKAWKIFFPTTRIVNL